MGFLYFMIGGSFGVIVMAVFAVRAYEKGYEDGVMDTINDSSSNLPESEEYLQYKKQLAEFMQSVNPKPTIEDAEKLRIQYLKKREKKTCSS